MSSYEDRIAERRKKYITSKPVQESTQTPAPANIPTPANAQGSKNKVSYAANSPVSDRIAGRAAKYSDTAVDENYISSFLNDAESFSRTNSRDSERIGVGNSSGIYQDRKKTGDDLSSRSYNIRNYLNKNKDSIPAEYYNEFISYLDTFDQWNAGTRYDYYSQDKFYSQWESEEDYQQAVRQYGYQQKYSDKSYSELKNILGQLEDGEEKDWLSTYAPTVMTDKDYGTEIAEINTRLYYVDNAIKGYREIVSNHGAGDNNEDAAIYEQARQYLRENGFKNIDEAEALWQELNDSKWALTNERKYNSLEDREDFAEKSRVAADGITTGFGIGIGRSWWGKGDPVYDYINDLEGTRMQHMAGTALNGGDPYSIYDKMEDEEIDTYNYIYNTEGEDAANEYLDYLEYTLNQRRAEGTRAMAQKMAAENPFLASLISVPINLTSGTGVIDVAFQNLERNIHYAATGEYSGPIDYNRDAMAGTVISSTIRKTRAEHYANKYGVIKLNPEKHPVLSKILNGKSLGDVYQLGMSMADSAAIRLLVPVMGRSGTLLLGGSAASQGILNAVERGATDEQALKMGFFNGLWETLFESWSLDRILSMNTNNILKAFVTQGFIEATEESNTSIANYITDVLVMGNSSEFAMKKAAYMEHLSPEDAAKQAFWDAVIQVGWDFAGGFISGGIMGGTSAPIQYAQYNHDEAERLYGPSQAELVGEAAEINPDNNFVNRMQRRVEAGKDLSGRQLYRLVQKNEKALRAQDMTAIQEAAANRLTELGETGDVQAIGKVLAKQVAGKRLTNAEQDILAGSRYAQRVANELNPDNIRSEGYASNWAERIGTERINPEEYSRLAEDAEQAQDGNLQSEQQVPAGMAGTEERANEQQGNAAAVAGNESRQLQKNTPAAVETAEDGAVLIADTVQKMDVSPETANALVQAFDPAKGISAAIYALDIREAYNFGKYNYTKGIAENDPYAAAKRIAWNDGRIAAIKESDTAQEAVVAMYEEAKQVLKDTGREVRGEFHAVLEDGITEESLNESQKASYQLADRIAQGAKVNVRVYVGGAEQGYYRPSTDEIYLNVNATNQSGESMMAFVLGHEPVHRARIGSPKKFQKFADYLMLHYTKNGADLNDMIAEQKDAYKRHGIELTDDEAFEEVVADACQRMLLDTDAGKKLAEYGAQSKENKSLLDDIKKWFNDLLEKLKSIFVNVDPDSMAAREFDKFSDRVKQILADMYVDMTVEAGEHLSTIHAVINDNAKAIPEGEIITDGAVVTAEDGVKYSIKSMKADIAEGQMFEDLKTYCGWSQAQVDALRRNLNDLVEYMTPYRDVLDMNESYGREGRRFSPYKPNSDPLYKISMDFSTLCSKRLLTQYVIENLQLRENRPMTAEEQMAIRDMLNEYRKVEKGLQVACAMCYVEAARLKSPKQINKWLADPAEQMKNYFADKNSEFAAYIKEKQADFKESRGYDRNATKKDMSAKDVRELNKIRPRLRSQYQLTAEEAQIVERAKALPASTYLTAGNLATLSETDPTIYAAYTSFVRTATRSKSLETDEPYYYGDSRRDNGNGIIVSDSFIEAVNKENGMRFSSWSDWRIQHMLDYITAVIDNSVRGAAMHGYTKFGDEVRVLGKTGMMFNMSGVPGTQTGLNEDGSLSFSSTESIDVNEAIQLRKEFPETAGLQCIGVSDDHIRALLRSDIIDYVIPYHVSGLNAGLRAMANIQGWSDYTSTQHAAIDKSVKLEDAADKEHWREEPVFSEFFVGYDTGMTGIEAMRASADRYAQMCKARGLKPKFEQFLNEDNYWKLLIDRKMINQVTGKLIQQRAVTPTFDFDTIKGVVDRYVQNYDSGLEARALNHIVENWDSIPKRIRDLKKQNGKKPKKVSKAVDTLANETLAAQPKGVEAEGNARLKELQQEGVSFKLPITQNTPYRRSAYDEWDVSAALDDALDHADSGDDNMIRVGEMPHFISDMLGIEGDFYIYRNHAYENMVSEKQALKDSRPTMRKKKKIHFHDLGKQRMQDAILALESPIMAIADSTDKENPKIVMILPVEGNNDAPLYAAMSFYDDQPINGSFARKPHLVLTVAERGFESGDGHDGYVDVVNEALKKGRILSLDREKMRAYMPVIAGLTRVGNIADSALADNIARFRKEINAFREKNHIDYKLPVGEDTSPRALLANAFEGVVQNDIERRNLEEYKKNVDILNAEEAKLQDLRAQIRELSFARGPRDTQKIRELQFDATHTANRIATLDKMLLRFEASEPIKKVLEREKEMVRKRERDRVKEAAENYRKKGIETMEKREARIRLEKLVVDTAKWISSPKKGDVKCPDILKVPYAEFLSGIDTSSKRLAAGGDPTKADLKLANAMGSLATALERITSSQDPNQDSNTVLDSGYLDLPANFVQKLRDMTENIKALMVDGDFVVNNMTAKEVRELSQMIRTLNHAIREMSTLYANLRFANVEELGNDSMGFMDDLGEIEKTGGVANFVEWDNALPYYAFKRFGNGGESIFEGLMDAQDKLANLAKEIFDFQEKTWTGKEAKAWSKDTHTIDLPSGAKLTLTTADAMSIYCLSRRTQGLQHLLGGGVRVIGLQEGSRKAKDSRSVLSIQDVEAINSSLTERQREVAEGIQEFMSTVCSEWGNEISMKRFLTSEFNEKNYFPIESNDENLPTKDPAAQQSDLFRLLNISATKAIDPRANNEVIVRNIFDVFTGHASDMARLNSFGLPLLDYMKWLNYREKTVNEDGQITVRGVRKSMETAFGTAAKSYVMNLIKDVNGRPSDGGLPSFYVKMLRNAKTAMVGNSIRVAALQYTSYARAAMVLSPKSMALGFTKLPNIERAKKYCGIALWKSFGFYDTNISRSIEEQMKGVTDVRQKLIELSLKGAEIGDAITWGVLWNACEYEVAKTTQNRVGSEEFYQEVGKKLREVIYATQVVDSVLTRSEIMRSKNTKAQELSAFMSEPTLSANILMDAGMQFSMENRRTGSVKRAWKNTGKYVGKALAVYGISQLVVALMEGIWDAWRDDDDEEFLDKFAKAFRENLILDLIPFNKIPIISDMTEAATSLLGLGYFSSENIASTGISQMVSAIKAWTEVLGDNSSTTVYNALYKSMRAVSSFYGVAFAGIMREGVALWNNTAGAYDSTLKLRNYETSKADKAGALLDAIIEGNDRQAESLRAEFEDEKAIESAMRSAIKSRYESGEIDANTALEYLVIYGGMDAGDANWKVEEWEFELQNDGEDFKKYDEFFDAVQTGQNLNTVIRKYTDNGVRMTELRSQITSHFKPEYLEMTASERAGIKGYLMNAMVACGMDRDDAEDNMKEWDFEAENGFAYSDRRTAYLDGDITAAQLRKALINFGGYEPQNADAQIQVYDLEEQGYDAATVSNVNKYNEYCRAAGVSYADYFRIIEFSENTENDIDPETGKRISYSAVRKVMAEINSLAISDAQKEAIALSLWKESTVSKYRLW